MNSLYGTIRLMSEDALYYFGRVMVLSVILPLTLVWIMLDLFFGATIIGISISGVAYFFIVFFAVGSHLSLYKVALGLGSTRVQILKAYYVTGIVAVIVSLTFLNLLQHILSIIFSNSNINLSISHPWDYLVNGNNFFSLLGIELLFGIFLFNLTFLFYSIYFRLGFRKLTILFILLSFTGLILYYSGHLYSGMEWVLKLEMRRVKWLLINVFSLGSFLSIFLSYSIMRNASLQLKTRKD